MWSIDYLTLDGQLNDKKDIPPRRAAIHEHQTTHRASVSSHSLVFDFSGF
jgi:hypothetical protein